MALVNCNECGNQVSTAASTCPKCGAPVSSGVSSVSAPEKSAKKLSTLTKVGGGFVLFFSALVIFVFIQGIMETNEQQERLDSEIARINSLPEMPIQVTYREALMGSGLVSSFKNTSNRHLSVLVALENPSMNQSKSIRLDLAPGQVTEIGHMEGWAFSSGDKISVTHNEYRPENVSIP